VRWTEDWKPHLPGAKRLFRPSYAYLPLLTLVRSGQLDMSPIKPKVFSLPDLWQAIEYAGKTESLELAVVTSANSKS